VNDLQKSLDDLGAATGLHELWLASKPRPPRMPRDYAPSLATGDTEAARGATRTAVSLLNRADRLAFLTSDFVATLVIACILLAWVGVLP
jgi:hypothetical protein